MKKIVSICLAVCLSVVALCSLSACGKKTIKGTVALDKTTIALPVGGAASLVATFTPDKEGTDVSSVTIKWESSSSAVASVADGVVTAVATGQATVTASQGKASATCTVRVFDPDNREPVTATNARINVSNRQNKMTIDLKKSFGYLYADGDMLVEIKDENGEDVPFTLSGNRATVDWTGDVGFYTWSFLTADYVITADVCNATHIIGKIEDFGPLSADWDIATTGNVSHDWAYQNDTKDWYIVLDNDINASGGGDDLSYKETYTFGRNFAADAPLDDEGDPIGGDERYAVFNGTFDGRGYSILGLNTQAGLIANLGATGVIKNLAMLDARNGRNFSSGILGLRGCGLIENVFIEGQLREWSTSASGTYLFTHGTHRLEVKDSLVIVYLYRGTWPTDRKPGVFTSTWISNAPKITNSYGISSDIAYVDGAGTSADGILYATIQEWIADGGYAGLGGIWEIGQNDIFFGGQQVYVWED